MSLSQQVQQHAEIVKTAAIGATGTGASVFLQDFNQLMAGLAAFATFIYVSIKIYQALRKKD